MADIERDLLDVSTSIARARDELVEASRGVARARADHACLLAERIVLVLRAHDTGIPNRKIGAAADLSEVMVRKIVSQHGPGRCSRSEEDS